MWDANIGLTREKSRQIQVDALRRLQGYAAAIKVLT